MHAAHRVRCPIGCTKYTTRCRQASAPPGVLWRCALAGHSCVRLRRVGCKAWGRLICIALSRVWCWELQPAHHAGPGRSLSAACLGCLHSMSILPSTAKHCRGQTLASGHGSSSSVALQDAWSRTCDTLRPQAASHCVQAAEKIRVGARSRHELGQMPNRWQAGRS